MNCGQKIFLILLFFTSSIFSQWTNQNLVPEGNHLWSTFFINDNTGWIVGSEGLIRKTYNGGLDWEPQNSGTNLTLKSIQFVNQTIGWITGENGLILKSIDGGQTWTQQNSNTTESLNDLHFSNLNTGYVVGVNGIILKTTDGGLSWSAQVSGVSKTLYSVDFVDDLMGYVVGDNHLFLKTTDGGTNWDTKNLSLNGVPIINCVEFINSQIGWIGYGFDKYSSNILKTTDGGESWSSTAFAPVSNENSENHLQMENPFDVQVGIRSIYFKDSNNGYAVGGTYDGWNRCIYTTTNGGNTWQSKYIYSEQTGLLSVRVNDAGEGFAVGYSGVIYRTDDGGSSWSQLLSGNNNLYYSGDCLTSVFMVNENIGWAGGYRKGIWYYPILMKTTNGGKIWETNKEFSNDFIGTEANIYFLNENIGWVNFYDRSSYKTTDGGENWIPSGNAGNIKYFINQDTGWGTYEPLGIFKSTDGGSTWAQKSSVSSRSIFFPDINNGWAVGAGGNILKSTDQGESWFAQISGTSSNLNSIDLFNDNIGMCVGNAGTILMTENGGDNWISQNSGTMVKLNSIVFTSDNSVWVAGMDGIILNSADLGNNWVTYNNLTANNLYSVCFTNENTGWVAGSNGTMLKYKVDVVPVELTSFTAKLNNSSIELNWQTGTEVNNLGFEIERKNYNTEWIKIGFVEGHINSVTPNTYNFTDINPVGSNRYKYRLKQIDTDGLYKYSDIVEVELNPNKFELFQNYPNPFNPTTKIRYQLPNASNVEIKVYDVLGNEVLTLLNENKGPGIYEMEINGQNLSSGTYIYQIVAGNFVQTKKMLLLK